MAAKKNITPGLKQKSPKTRVALGLNRKSATTSKSGASQGQRSPKAKTLKLSSIDKLETRATVTLPKTRAAVTLPKTRAAVTLPKTRAAVTLPKTRAASRPKQSSPKTNRSAVRTKQTSPRSTRAAASPNRALNPSNKAVLTKTLKKMYKIKNANVTLANFSAQDQRKAMNMLELKKRQKNKRKETWTKMQIIKYLDHIGKPSKYTLKNMPMEVIERYSRDNNFNNFKKFEGYRLLFRKLKGRSAKTDKEIYDFIDLLKKERMKPRKKRV